MYAPSPLVLNRSAFSGMVSHSLICVEGRYPEQFTNTPTLEAYSNQIWFFRVYMRTDWVS
jgi:hypothetical protein